MKFSKKFIELGEDVAHFLTNQLPEKLEEPNENAGNPEILANSFVPDYVSCRSDLISWRSMEEVDSVSWRSIPEFDSDDEDYDTDYKSISESLSDFEIDSDDSNESMWSISEDYESFLDSDEDYWSNLEDSLDSNHPFDLANLVFSDDSDNVFRESDISAEMLRDLQGHFRVLE